MPGADVFISYRRDQRERIQVIAKKLQELGLSVWFDARLEAGASFDEEINREVKSAKAVFVCWSPEAVQSRWVRAEASIGLERDVLVAAFLQPAELIPPYNLVHATSLEGWEGEHEAPGWRDVLDRIGRLVGRPQLGEEARAKSLDAEWADRDRTERAVFDAKLVDARKRFQVLHQARPAAFDQDLRDARAEFESWILRRRMTHVGEAPDPLTLVDDQAESIRAELEITRRERDAAIAHLQRTGDKAALANVARESVLAGAQPKAFRPVGIMWSTALFIVALLLAVVGLLMSGDYYSIYGIFIVASWPVGAVSALLYARRARGAWNLPAIASSMAAGGVLALGAYFLALGIAARLYLFGSGGEHAFASFIAIWIGALSAYWVGRVFAWRAGEREIRPRGPALWVLVASVLWGGFVIASPNLLGQQEAYYDYGYPAAEPAAAPAEAAPAESYPTEPLPADPAPPATDPPATPPG